MRIKHGRDGDKEYVIPKFGLSLSMESSSLYQMKVLCRIKHRIGPRLIFTAVHNIYNSDRNQKCDKDSMLFTTP
jgi:hypothetical protein